MKILERFLNYVKVYTTSEESSETSPSTKRQFDLANILKDEMIAIGFQNVQISEYGNTYGMIPASEGFENSDAIGLMAHIDTAPDCSGENVRPQIIPNYDGKDVELGTSGRRLTAEEFPELPSLKGRTLITTDGTTLLGADDKAGVAEIMTACETVIREKIPHGPIYVVFTTDEEIGRGADHIDQSLFKAKYAYTADGGPENELSYENFNAASAKIEIEGFNVHPGTAKNVMRNASLIAMEINGLLPGAEIPSHTENYEGFYHLCEMSGTVEKASLVYILRDHDAELLRAKKETMTHIIKFINEKYGEGTASLVIKDSYQNMAEIIKKNFFLIDRASDSMKEAGLEPMIIPVRGGTDGARLSFDGIPCPNIGTGGYAYHGPYEHITLEGMDADTRVILGIIRRFATNK